MEATISLLKIFWRPILSPFKVHVEMRDGELESLTLPEAIGISWIFIVIKGFYLIIGLNIGILMLDIFKDRFDFIDFIAGKGIITAQKVTVISSLAEIVLYPIIIWLYAKFGATLLKFFVNLFSPDRDDDEVNKSVTQLINSLFSSAIFLAIPIVGGTLSFISFMIILFGGLRHNLRFNVGQTAITMLSPIILLALFVLMFIAYILFMISILWPA